MPKNLAYPRDRRGKFLHLLAQINFEECPNIEPFPQSGILQLYIGDDDLNGLDFANPLNQDGFRVLYLHQVDKSNAQSDFGFLPEAEFFPLGPSPYSLAFVTQDMPVTIPDYRFEKAFGAISDLPADFLEEYHNRCSGSGHRIGGYPYFTQQNPRYDEHYADKDILLLQIDTDEGNNIMWGDCGVGGFFISSTDLKSRDFSSVLYNWDCC